MPFCRKHHRSQPHNRRLAWYYQETPHDSWDYDATQKMILTDLPINGKRRPVLMQASKNGFFYILDRRTGKLLSAKAYVYTYWASRIDMKTGRPVLTGQGDWLEGTQECLSVLGWRSHLEPDVLQPQYALRVHPGARRPERLG